MLCAEGELVVDRWNRRLARWDYLRGTLFSRTSYCPRGHTRVGGCNGCGRPFAYRPLLGRSHKSHFNPDPDRARIRLAIFDTLNWEARMNKSKMLTALTAIAAVVLTSAVAPASAARRHAAWRGAAIAAGVGAGLAAAAAASTYYSGYGYGRYGSYGYGHYGRCGGGAYC
jgi:hypothetical protein